MIFLTEYTSGEGTYGAYIEAENRAHALVIADRRQIGERVMGEVKKPGIPPRLLPHIKAGRWLDAAHEATFLCFVAASSGAITPREALSDTGLVHQLLHMALWPAEPEDDHDRRERRAIIRAVKALAMDIEWRTPGYLRSFSGQPGVRTYVNGVRTPDRDAGE